jgi:hypothetical protein
MPFHAHLALMFCQKPEVGNSLLFLMGAASDIETGALRGRGRKERVLEKSWGEVRGRWSPTANGNSPGWCFAV